MKQSRQWAVMVLLTIALVSCKSAAYAGGAWSSCTRTTSAGGWAAYTGACYCGTIWVGWGSNGTDRARWSTSSAGVARDMYMTYRHAFGRRANGDTSADQWSYAEGSYSGSYGVSQQGSGCVESTLNARASYNGDDWLEVGSDGGGGLDTVADWAKFYPEYDATYAGKSTESYMYAGNVYQWRYLMSNPSSAWGSWGASIRFAHTGGVTSGPGWYNGDRVNNGPGTGPGGTMDLYFNMRPTTTGDYNEDFQMVYEGVSWFGDKWNFSNANMRTWTRLSRKTPGATDGWDTGGKKKGETVRFSVAGADSWGTGNSYAWDWDGTTAQGWQPANACTVTQEDSNDRLRINVTGGDPHCVSSNGLAINAATCKYMTIRMASSGGSTAEMFWSSSVGGFSAERRVEWSIISDGQWHVYRIALPTSWSGTIYQVRLDPVAVGAANGQTVYVDWLRIHHVNEGLSGVAWLATSQSSWDILTAGLMTWDTGSQSWYTDYTLAHGYPQTYYACLRVKNDVAQESDNHDRRFGGSGGGWGYRSYKVLNTPPTAANASLAGNPWTTDNTPALAWTYADADPNAQSNYRLQVDDDSAFGSPAVDTDYVAGAGISHTPGILADGQWYYRVGVLDGVSQSARNGAYTGGVTLGQSGGVTGNTSASFDGTDDHVALPAFNDSFGSGMTIEFWANPTASNSFARFLDFGNGAPSDNILLYRSGTSSNLIFEVRDDAAASTVTAAGAIINNEWHHYAAVLDSNRTARIYRDGTLLASGTLYMPNPLNRTLNYIGRSNWTGDAYYAGGMDEFAIYDRPLSQTDIQAHYAARTNAETYRQHVLAHSPWAYYRFGESSGTTAANLNGGQGWSAGTGFKVDATKPTNPGASCSDGKASEEWRNGNAPTFTLSGAEDTASGLKALGSSQRYRYYFGTISDGAPVTGTDSTDISPAVTADGTYYLRVQTQDNAGNWSDPVTVFTYKYDGTAPSAAPAVSTTSNSSGITINFEAGSDSGANQSGLTSAPYTVSRTAFNGFDSGPLSAAGAVVDTEAQTELAAGDVATYTVTTSDTAGNVSTDTISARKTLDGTAWIYTTGASSMAAPGLIPNVGSPAATGVFAGSNDYRLHGMETGDGDMLFGPVGTVNTVLDRTAPIRDFAAYGLPNPMVFASSLDGNVYARKYESSDWAPAWTQQAVTAGYAVKVKPGGKLLVTISNLPEGKTNPRNIVVVGTYDNSVNNSFVAMDMADGEVLWTTTPGTLATVTGSPVIYGNIAYFTSYSFSGSPSIWAVNLTNGAVIWSRSDAGSISSAPALSADGSVLYVGNDDGTVYAFSTANGTSPALWTNALGDGAVFGAPWPAGATLFVSTSSKVHKLSASNGASAGSPWPVSVSLPSIPVVGASGKLYVGASGGAIYEIVMDTGATKTKSLGAAAGTIGDPVLGTDDGQLYVGAADGRIYKVAVPLP